MLERRGVLLLNARQCAAHVVAALQAHMHARLSLLGWPACAHQLQVRSPHTLNRWPPKWPALHSGGWSLMGRQCSAVVSSDQERNGDMRT